MWSLFVPLGKPSRFSSILCNYWKCSTYRQLSQSSGGKPVNRRSWTAEEDRKLRDLVQQGFGTTRIASEMSDRSFATVEWRLTLLKAGGKPPQVEGGQGLSRPWTTEENALVLEKRRQGASLYDLMNCFPDRTFSSVMNHIRRLETWPTDRRRRAKDFTEKDLQRIVELKVEGGKTHHEIAHEMECSTRTLEYVWRTRCSNLVSKEAQEFIWQHQAWTPREEEHLLELHRRGTISALDAALHFPSKTQNSVQKKIMRERLEFPKQRRGRKKQEPGP
jgi:transposase-like protein